MLLYLLLAVLALIYFWSRRTFSYFSNLGIPQEPGYFPLGSKSSWKMLFAQLAFTEIAKDIYERKKKDDMVGYYGPFGQRIVVVNSMDLAKRVMIQDFDHFTDGRHLDMHEEANKYLLDMLPNLRGEKWKRMRSKISPAFTSGKLKAMVPLIHKVADEMVLALEAKEGKEFDGKEMMTTYALDVIASTGYGVDINSFKDPDNLFRKNARILTMQDGMGVLGYLRVMFSFMMPTISKLFHLSFLDPAASKFVVEIIRKQINDRKKSGIKRNDFIDVFIASLSDSSWDNGSDTNSKIQDVREKTPVLTKKELEDCTISNAFILFFAGFETSSTILTMVLHFLAADPGVQGKLYDEVKAVVEANGGDEHLDSNALQTLEYTEMCILETMRRWPLTPLERTCVKDYKVPGTDMVIEKDVLVQIPGPEMMLDSEFFENPLEFRPDNMSADAKERRGPYPFMGFGHGPRNCVGMRSALLNIKIALSRLVLNFEILPSGPPQQLEIDPKSFSGLPKGNVHVKVKKRQ